eukprot:1362994-Amorphochlora_amoeboformis.AAC.2
MPFYPYRNLNVFNPGIATTPELAKGKTKCITPTAGRTPLTWRTASECKAPLARRTPAAELTNPTQTDGSPGYRRTRSLSVNLSLCHSHAGQRQQ